MPLAYHGGAGLYEPVESELGRVPNALTQLLVNVLLVEAHLVQHTNQKPVLFLGVVLSFAGAVLYP